MASLAEMLGYLVQPLGGPGIPALAKSPNNVSAGSPMAAFQLKGPPESSPAEVMAALTAINKARYENELHKAQAEQARETAALFKSAVEVGGQGPTYTTDGTVAGPAASAPTFGNLAGGGSGVRSGGGSGGWGPLAEPAIQALRDAGASESYIQAQMAHGLAEGGFKSPWVKSAGNENSFGHWQLNAKGELPAYLAWVNAKGGDPQDTRMQALYTMETNEKRQPGITKTDNPGAAMDAIASNFERYKGHGPGQRRGFLADAQKAMSGGVLEDRMPLPVGPGQLPEGILAAVPNFAGMMAGNRGPSYAPEFPPGAPVVADNSSAPLGERRLPPGTRYNSKGEPISGDLSRDLPGQQISATQVTQALNRDFARQNAITPPGAAGRVAASGAAPVSVVPLGSDVAPMSLAPGMTAVPQASGLPRLDAASLERARRMENIYGILGKKMPTWAEEGIKMTPGGSLSPEYLGVAAGAKKGGEFPWAAKELTLKNAFDVAKARLEASLKDRAAGLVFDETTGAVTSPLNYNTVVGATEGAKTAAQEAAKARLDIKDVVETLPDGKTRIDRPITRLDLATRIAPQPGGGATASPFGKPFSTETESAFSKGIAGVATKRFEEGMTLAESAAAGIRSTNEARQLLDKGIITGMGGDFRLNLARALNLVGLNDAETIKNTEAYVGSRGQAVIAVAKAFGTGSGFSSTDREYVEKMTAGKIALNEESIRKLLDINERADRFAVREHNKRVKQIDPNFSQYSLIVEEPVSTAPGRSGVTSGGVKWSRD